jgi:hypothetical protein
MLTAMQRWMLIAVAIAGCSKSAGNQDKVSAPPAAGSEKAAVAAPKGPPPPPTQTVDDPRFHLQPQEGTLEIDPAQGPAGSEATAGIKLSPAEGYHVATDYPIKLTLEPPAGVTLAKAELTAGGRDKAQGDATALSEHGLAFAVKATPEKPGDYQIKGTFKFGVCDKDSCHPKKQPITITVAAK